MIARRFHAAHMLNGMDPGIPSGMEIFFVKIGNA